LQGYNRGIVRKLLISISLALLVFSYVQAQSRQERDRRIRFPNVLGYLTLKCDLHIHTVFSDGAVWPDIRVQEALLDGLDAISLTEHLEYQPHSDDIPHPDRNRSYEIAKEAATNESLIIIRGSEITRDMPPGHNNTIFIEDANKLLKDNALEVFREAKRQGGFSYWNHPNWTAQKPDGKAELTDMHRQLIREGLLQGIEVVNELTYSDEALQIALDNNLTILATSDIHGLVDWLFEVPEGGHRPVTLVFSEERTQAGIEAGLRAGRTVAWFNNTLIGKEENLKPLIEASLTVKESSYLGDTDVLTVMIENTSDAAYLLDNQSEFTFHRDADLVTLAPQGVTMLEVKTGGRRDAVSLEFEVLNAITAPGTHPELTLDVSAR
jgi:3',5'-nucleoside bisphosphate phosphatase